MKFIIITTSIVLPLFMYYIQLKKAKIKTLFHIIALVAILVLGNIAAISIYQIILEGKVFTMSIHGLFLNPYFLLSGAYLGIYFIYNLLQLSHLSLLGKEKR